MYVRTYVYIYTYVIRHLLVGRISVCCRLRGEDALQVHHGANSQIRLSKRGGGL